MERNQDYQQRKRKREQEMAEKRMKAQNNL